MRPWAQQLAAQGWSVRLPLLPGHGTHWKDANRTTWRDWYGVVDKAFDELKGRCAKVFVCGLSMGGGLALRLAEEHGDDIAGVVVVNPSVILVRWDAKLLPVLAKFVPSAKAIGNDIAMPGVFEGRIRPDADKGSGAAAAIPHGDPRRPRQGDPAAAALPLGQRSRRRAGQQPDRPQGRKSADVEEVVLDKSYHVATLDHDAPRIFAGSVDFIKRDQRPVNSASTCAAARNSSAN
jgi:carboxylesterase